MQYDWPGNVRELENVIQRIVIVGTESTGWNPLLPRRGERRSALRDRRQSAESVAAAPPHMAAPVVSIVHAAPPPVPPPAPVPEPPPESPSLKLIGRNAARAAEREMMLRTLHRTRWNRKEAAEILGISYKALLYKIKEHRLDDPLTDPDPPSRG
jgi:DNA-binding NtrC family response regulator